MHNDLKGGLVLEANFMVWLQAVTSFFIKNGVILPKKRGLGSKLDISLMGFGRVFGLKDSVKPTQSVWLDSLLEMLQNKF